MRTLSSYVALFDQPRQARVTAFDAACALARLNQHVKRDVTKAHQVYRLKEALIRRFYLDGRAVDVRLEPKGDGLLYLFRFDVDGYHFSWHAPFNVVTWRVVLCRFGGVVRPALLGDGSVQRDLQTVQAYLRTAR